jgi:hypothetical protein
VHEEEVEVVEAELVERFADGEVFAAVPATGQRWVFVSSV